MCLQDNLHNLLNWFLSSKSKCLEKEGKYGINLIAENISLGYRYLLLRSSVLNLKKLAVEELDEAEYLRKDKSFLTPVIELKRFAQRELKDCLVDCLIHGSISTLDYAKGWSDFDTYLIIKNDVVINKDFLVGLRDKLLFAYNFLLKICPSQHHGFLLCSEKDLFHYPSYYMPVEALKYAKSLFYKNEIIFHEIETGEKRKRNFKDLVSLLKETYETGIFPRFPYKDEYLLARFKNANNGFYQFKNYVGYLAIAPAYFLEAKGTSVYKRDAFSLVKEEISENDWKIIDKITTLRNEWPLQEKFPYPGNRIPTWARELIGEDYFKEGYEFIKALNDKLVSY